MPKILFICGQEVVKEKNDGGKLCSYRNWELFREVYGYDNAFLLMFSSYKDNEKNIIRLPSHKNSLCKALNIVTGHMFSNKFTEETVLTIIKDYNIDLVVFERSMFGSLIKKIKSKTNCKIWVFLENIEQMYFKNKCLHRGFVYYLPYLCVSKSEKTSVEYADKVIALTYRDKKLLKEVYNIDCSDILPMTFKDRFDRNVQNVSDDKKQLLFIGTMFPPNYDGVKWFVENVMKELPDYTLTIVGKNFETKKQELEKVNVKVIGTVDQLSPYYYFNNVMIMPIFYGDGMKVKTAESLMYGKVIFATDEALEGYEVSGVKNIFRCNTKEEFVSSIKNFFNKKDINYFSEDCRQLFINKYSFDQQVIECKEKWNK